MTTEVLSEMILLFNEEVNPPRERKILERLDQIRELQLVSMLHRRVHLLSLRPLFLCDLYIS
jgi:hypothetical protein